MKGKIKIFVGLSGGVDSAVSAALLKRDGYDVTGVFIKAWNPPDYPCTWREDRRSAMKVAAILDIPFITLDLEKEYKKEVVDYMVSEYKAGRTPNPDVMCNKEIKFGHFLKFALNNGAQYVATGHYARAVASPQLRRGRDEVRVRLLEGADKNKDQSYFLWTLTQEQLKHILFPIGGLQKSEVRKLAAKFKLPQAARKDSQGLCFLGKIDMKEFLKEYAGAKKGKVLNENGEIIGEHEGAILYTIGERHGFTIAKKFNKEAPLYVISKNIKTNIITVGQKPDPQHFGRSSKMLGTKILMNNINWVNREPDFSRKYSCRIRYRQEKVKCKIMPQKSKQQGSSLLDVVFSESQFGVSPGQSLVLYDKEICLGGGIIDSTRSL